jgi:hypothetical protein
MPLHSESPEARWLAENYADEARPGARYAGQWVVVRGEGIVTGASSPEEIAAYVRTNYPNPADVLIARLVSDPLG